MAAPQSGTRHVTYRSGQCSWYRSMRSVCSRRSDAAHAACTDAASRRASRSGSSSAPAAPAAAAAVAASDGSRFEGTREAPAKPITFVATTTRSRHAGFAASQLPTISSVRPGRQPGAEEGTGYISAVSMKLTPRSFTA